MIFKQNYFVVWHCLAFATVDAYEVQFVYAVYNWLFPVLQRRMSPLADSVSFNYFAADSVPHIKVQNKSSHLWENWEKHLYEEFAYSISFSPGKEELII